MNRLDALADRAAMESAVGVAAAFDEGYRFPKRSTRRLVWLAFRMLVARDDFKKAELSGRIASYWVPKDGGA